MSYLARYDEFYGRYIDPWAEDLIEGLQIPEGGQCVCLSTDAGANWVWAGHGEYLHGIPEPEILREHNFRHYRHHWSEYVLRFTDTKQVFAFRDTQEQHWCACDSGGVIVIIPRARWETIRAIKEHTPSPLISGPCWTILRGDFRLTPGLYVSYMDLGSDFEARPRIEFGWRCGVGRSHVREVLCEEYGEYEVATLVGFGDDVVSMRRGDGGEPGHIIRMYCGWLGRITVRGEPIWLDMFGWRIREPGSIWGYGGDALIGLRDGDGFEVDGMAIECSSGVLVGGL